MPDDHRSLRTGDVITMRAKPLPLAVRWAVVEIDPSKGRLRLSIHLPLGILNEETITVVAQDEQHTLVRFY